jgi:hypothetical protein
MEKSKSQIRREEVQKDGMESGATVERNGMETKQLQPFFFPNVGEGVTVMAKDQAEANEKLAELRKDMQNQTTETISE